MAGETIESVFRDFETNGVPSSGKHEPRKAAIRNLLNILVFGESPESATIHLNNAGEGTGDAIEVTTAAPMTAAAFSVLYELNITHANTGAVTVSVNGDPAIPLINNQGGELLAGTLQPGMAVLVADDGTNLRMLTDGRTVVPGAAGRIAFYDGNGNLVPGDPAEGTGNMNTAVYDPDGWGGRLFPFESRAAAEAATVPAPVKRISVLHAGHVLQYVRETGATALVTADGATWGPAETATVLHWGAVGDCSAAGAGTIDDAAVQAALNWVAGGDFRELVFPAGHRYRITTAISCDTDVGRKGCKIIMHGPVTPDETAFRAFDFRGFRDSELKLYVEGGGVDADYTTADPLGGSEAFYIRSCRHTKIDIVAHSYAGRVFRTILSLTPYKLSFLDISLDCGDIATSAGSAPCGQACFIQSDSAFGGFRYLNSAWTKYSPVFDSVVDCVMPWVEHGAKSGGSPMEFRGCGSIWIGQFNFGDETKTITGLRFIRNEEGNGCRRINIDCMFAVEPLTAIEVDGAVAEEYALHVGRLECRGAAGPAVVVNDSNGVSIGKLVSNGDQQALKVTGTSRDIKADIWGYNSLREAVEIGTGVRDVEITGVSRNASTESPETHASVKVDSTETGIVFDQFNTRGADPAASFDLVVGNNVSVLGGRYESGTFIGGVLARTIRNAQGLRTENAGSATILNGQTFVDIPHLLIGVPDIWLFTGRGSEAKDLYLGAAPDGANIRVQLPAPATADRPISWWAAMSEAHGT